MKIIKRFKSDSIKLSCIDNERVRLCLWGFNLYDADVTIPFI